MYSIQLHTFNIPPPQRPMLRHPFFQSHLYQCLLRNVCKALACIAVLLRRIPTAPASLSSSSSRRRAAAGGSGGGSVIAAVTE